MPETQGSKGTAKDAKVKAKAKSKSEEAIDIELKNIWELRNSDHEACINRLNALEPQIDAAEYTLRPIKATPKVNSLRE